MNISLTPTIQVLEVLWVLVAIPGLVRWTLNRRTSTKYVRALRSMGGGNGRMVVAKFAVRETTAFVTIESIFVLIGFLSMTSAPNPTALQYTSLVVALGFIAASVYITLLGRDWSRVDALVLRISIDRTSTEHDVREVVQNEREVEQNEREVLQDTRSTSQNQREKDQNARSARATDRQEKDDGRAE